MTKSLDIYIGWDSREPIAYDVARQSILENASIPVRVFPIRLADLVEQKAYTRDIDPLASTEFTYSRFFTPWLAGYKGWALFSAIVISCSSPMSPSCSRIRTETKAVACVHHDYTPKEGFKMDGKVQTFLSAQELVVFSASSMVRASLDAEADLRNSSIGKAARVLHRMRWAADNEIDEIPPNGTGWKAGTRSRPPARPMPCISPMADRGSKNWQNVDYGEQWTAKALAIDPDFKPI